MQPFARNWINGEFIGAASVGQSRDPATGQVIGSYADAGLDAARLGIEAARRAFRQSNWASDQELRARVLHQLADAFERNRDQLIALLALENGKIIPEAAFEIDLVAPKLRYFASRALVDDGRALTPKPGRISIVIREPVGVAGIIVPWNSPVVLAIRSLAPALAAGCTTVMKLPGEVAQVAHMMARIMSEAADLPRGVINLFMESGLEGSAHLVDDPDVPVISFTGSTRTGRAIAAAAARNLKRLSLELGGKTPMILFADADLDKAVPVLAKAVTTFAGQFCMAGSRLLVQRDIADRVRVGLAEHLTSVRPGPASDPSSTIGPLIDGANVARVEGLVRQAIDAGAKAIVRGGAIADGALADGAFFAPTLLEIEDQRLPIVQQETFGPVATLQIFDDEDEAAALANGSEYGLAASIWTRDVDRALRFARALDVGTIWINDWAQVFDGAEEGGYKQSGLGRLNGVAALEDFVEYKHIALNPGGA